MRLKIIYDIFDQSFKIYFPTVVAKAFIAKPFNRDHQKNSWSYLKKAVCKLMKQHYHTIINIWKEIAEYLSYRSILLTKTFVQKITYKTTQKGKNNSCEVHSIFLNLFVWTFVPATKIGCVGRNPIQNNTKRKNQLVVILSEVFLNLFVWAFFIFVPATKIVGGNHIQNNTKRKKQLVVRYF